MALTDQIQQDIGGKATHLVQLAHAGFRVPLFEVLPADVPFDELTASVERIGFPIAVRSSASVEDGNETSFAGQFKSFLDLRSLDAVHRAIRSCQQSAQEPSVREYCRQRRVDFRSIRMHVVVQRMIDAEISGVAFTIDPLTGESRVVIEACEGCGENLMAGKTNALHPHSAAMQKYRGRIEQLAVSVARHFGQPQDIEFAIASGELWLLQARPVTRIQFSENSGEWTNADFRDGGVSSTVCSPLMWSLYEKVWNDSLKATLSAIHLKGDDFEAGRMFFGRPYWNVGAVKARVARIPGYVERQFDEDLGMETPYEGDGHCEPIRLMSLLRAIPVVWGVSRFISRQTQHAQRIVGQGSEPIDSAGRELLKDPDGKLAAFLDSHYFPLESAYFKTIFALSLAKLRFHGDDPDADFSALVSGLPPLSHMGPEAWIRLQNRSDGDRCQESAMDAFAGKFKHHCRYGIDLIHPRWDEDLDFVAHVRSQLVETIAAKQMNALAEAPAVRRSGRHLRRLRNLIWLREELRDLSNRMYYYIRRAALAIAAERFLDEDVFFMTYSELIADDRGQIEAARATYESFRHYDAPHEIGIRYQGGGADSMVAAQLDDEGIESGVVWRGVAASRGRAEGIARVVETVEQAMRVEAGAILVCPFTEPGWTPALSRVSAVVTETGGLLSHAAVICREYGLPAVLSVSGAVRQIPDGARIRVDAMHGTVELLPSAISGNVSCGE